MRKNYEEMSDFEISRNVARALGIGLGLRRVRDNELAVRLKNGIIKDYCNNPSDAWPIIIENKICINAYGSGDGWSSTTDTSFFVDDDNPLRAAMICFLKMKDNEQ
ncbi:NinX [Vibrio phage vB_VaM_H2]|nr:NinX [Vibrio phage vB_VaM_H2]